jgi:hypothetical protein
VAWPPAPVKRRRSLLFLNRELADELRLDLAAHEESTLAAIFSGNALPEGATPIAQAYAGHQFGNFSPQLGDGRALLIGEVIDRHGRRRDLAFKGSGRTPFSRNGDGKAAVGPMLREVLIGEAMHALGIPTTRALAVIATGEAVHREETLPGALLTRVAASHIRVGTFEYFAARDERERVRQLADYAIARHDPELGGAAGSLCAMAARRRRTAGGAARAVDERRLHPRRDEHRQHEHRRRDHRLRPLRLHGGLPPGHGVQLDRPARALCLCQAARHRAVEPGALRRGHPAPAGRRRGRGGENRHRDPRRLRRQLSPPLAAGHARQAGLQAQAADSDTIDTALAEDWLALLQAGGADFTLAWRRLADAAAGRPERCANCFPTRRHWRPGSRAGGRAPRPKRGPPRNARRRCGG